MKNTTAILIVALGLILTPKTYSEAPPTGVYNYDFSGSLAVWDMTGTYSPDEIAGVITGDYTLTQDASGKFSGNGSGNFSSGVGSLDYTFTINGSVKSANGVTVVQMTEKMHGAGTVTDPETGDDIEATVSANISFKLTVDQPNGTLDGLVSGKVCASARGHGGGCLSLDRINGGEPVEFSVPLPDNMTGDWNLALNLNNVNDRLQVVDATIELSNGRTLALKVSAAYSANSGQTKLKLTNANNSSRGAQLNLVAHGLELQITKVAGKLLGQTLKQ